MMQGLAASSSAFLEKKDRILAQLAVPDADYTDASPKGSVDEGIRDLIQEINSVDGFVTTSSCAGRVSVFLEGRRFAEEGEDDDQVAGVGGKGAGGTWLFVSHDPVPHSSEAWQQILELEEPAEGTEEASPMAGQRLIHFKFEPMILHILTASLLHAQLAIRCALQAGFRESGAVNLISPSAESLHPIVAVRSMGMGFESLIGRLRGGSRERLVSTEYLRTLLNIGNERFVENAKRIERFRIAFGDALAEPAPRKNPDGEEWEDPAARRARMREEGLRRREMLRGAKSASKQRSTAEDEAEEPSLGLDKAFQ